MAKRPTLTARAGFVVSSAQAGDILDQSVLSDFYQPIVGAAPVATLLTLWQLKTAHPQLTQRQPLTKLLVRLNVGVSSLEASLKKLEAVGLLKTFFRQDSLGDCFIFEIQPTMTADDFIADPLMSVLLLDALGEDNFQDLVAHARRFELDTSQLDEVSAKLYDVFHLRADSDTDSQQALAHARHSTKVQVDSRPQLSLTNTDFSFPTLMTLLGQTGPSEDQIQSQRKLILTEHVLYGIDEPTMAKLILQATDLHNQFKASQFKRLVAQAYPRAVTSSSGQSKNPSSAEPKSADKQASSKSPQQVALERACQQYSPNDFLAKLKAEAGGGYVTPGETKILQRLIDEGKLSPAVINLLSWYVIADLGHATLSGNFVDAIANTWIRAGVKTVDDALKQIYLHYQKGKEHSSRRPRYRQRPTRQESRPQWQRDEAAGKHVSKTSAKQEAEVKKLLASLRHDSGK